MPRRQQQIAADKIVASQVFADTISGASPQTVTFTAAQSPQTLTSADSGKVFFITTETVVHNLPAVADISAGFNVTFHTTANNSASTIVGPDGNIAGSIVGATAAVAQAATSGFTGTYASSVAGDVLTLRFDGANWSVFGGGTAATWIAFA